MHQINLPLHTNSGHLQTTNYPQSMVLVVMFSWSIRFHAISMAMPFWLMAAHGRGLCRQCLEANLPHPPSNSKFLRSPAASFTDPPFRTCNFLSCTMQQIYLAQLTPRNCPIHTSIQAPTTRHPPIFLNSVLLASPSAVCNDTHISRLVHRDNRVISCYEKLKP